MAKIFISYRREDAQHQADRLHAVIAPHVEDAARDIFIDIDNIPLGVNFAAHLDEKVSQCEVLLALIGPGWLEARNNAGNRRLDDPEDFVRIEIASALKRGIPVVPVLLDGAPVPRAQDLPEDLKELALRHGTAIQRQSFEADAIRLIKGLGLTGAEPEPKLPMASPKKPKGKSRIPLTIGFAALLIAAATGVFAFLRVFPPNESVVETVQNDETEPLTLLALQPTLQDLRSEVDDVRRDARVTLRNRLNTARNNAQDGALNRAVLDDIDAFTGAGTYWARLGTAVAFSGLSHIAMDDRDGAIALLESWYVERDDETLRDELGSVLTKIDPDWTPNQVSAPLTDTQLADLVDLGDGIIELTEPESESAVPSGVIVIDTFKPSDTFRDTLSGGDQGPEMVVVPAGSFVMGSPSSEAGRDDDEGPQRTVRIGYQFAVGKYEVTWAEWEACVADGGCNYAGPEGAGGDNGWGKGNRPVINVSWEDAQAYVQWLSRKTGERYRLLSEAEWEYVARAGTTTRFSWGDGYPTCSRGASNGANFGPCASNRTEPVGYSAANAFGLHDLHGNVWEFVEDCYASSYSGAPTDGSAHTVSDCSQRVLRSGSWFNVPQNLRSADRDGHNPTNRNFGIGFRVARTL